MNKFLFQVIKLLLICCLVMVIAYYTLHLYAASNASPETRLQPSLRETQSQILSYYRFIHNSVLSETFGKFPLKEMSKAELRKNVYISMPNYEHNMKPKYYKAKGASFWQFDTYVLASELGRRLGCKYFIDIGCGSASKTANLQDEFQAIAVDYGMNFEKGRAKYPKIQFHEMDLSKKDCTLGLPEAVLREAVVVNADVIEHIPDPFSCILPLLANITKYAKAVVVSTPDRVRLGLHHPSGKPKNTCHVREWTLPEFEAMISDYDLVPVISGWCCNRQDCKSSSGHTTIIMVLATLPIIRAWTQESNIKITAFILVHSKTIPSLYNEVINYYSNQGIEVIVFTKEQLKLKEGHSTRTVIVINSLNDVIREVKHKCSMSAKNHWFMFVDGHEIIQPASQRIRKWTLADSIRAVDREPSGFNAIPMTILFSGLTRQSPIRYKWYVESVWQTIDSKALKPSFDTLRNRIRIWRNSVGDISLVVEKTTIGETIKDVIFPERRVFPYNYVSIRYQPEKVKRAFNVFDEGMQKSCVVDSALSYISKEKKSLVEPVYLY